MRIKHLQLNTSRLRDSEAVIDFISENEIDIACLQEVVYPKGEKSPLVDLCKKNNLHYFEGIHFFYTDKDLVVASAVVSRFPIEDYEVMYFNTPDYQPKEISESDFVGNELIDDDKIVESMASRGLKHTIKSRAVPMVTVVLDDQRLRILSIQFTVSSWATETEQMYKMSQLLTSKLQYSTDLPTIMSGDLNVQNDSYSVELLKTQLEYNSGKLKNTLSDNHRALVSDFPEGLAVDHVFSKKLKHMETKAHQVDFSDHKALVSEFEL